MRPLKLFIHGIGSYYTPTTVDFETLGEGGIFGIFGTTGSGKSTIVDSVIFALYGDLNEKALNLADYINGRMNEAEVRLSFTLTDNDGTVHFYEVVRSIAVDRRSGNTKPAKAELWDITDGRISLAGSSRDVTAKITELIGLTLREFANCIVLEQNKYDNFVKATDAERKEMVGNLFGLQRYGARLADEVKQRESELKMQLADLKARIDTLGNATEENLAELRTQAKRARETAEKTARERMVAKAQTEAGEKEAEQAQERAKILSEIAQTSKALASAAKDAEKHAEKAETVAASAKDGEKDARARIEDCLKKASVLEQNLEIDEEIKTTRSKLRTVQKQEADCKARLDAAEEESRRQLGISSVARQEKIRLIARYLLLSSVNLNPDDDGEITDRVAEYNGLLSAKVQTYLERKKLLTRAQEESKRVSEKENTALQARNSAAQRAEDARQTWNGATEIYSLAEEELAACRRDNFVAATISSLKEGDICPVCGHTIHQFGTSDASDITRLEEQTNELREQVRAARQCLDDVMETYRTADRDYAVAASEGAAARGAMQSARAALDELSLADTCTEQLSRCKEIGDNFKDVIGRLSASAKAYESAETVSKIDGAEYTRLSRDTEELEQKLNLLSSKREELLGGTETVAAALKANERKRDAASSEIELLAEKVNAANSLAATARELLANVQGSASAAQQRLAQCPETDFDMAAYARLKKRYEALTEQDKEVSMTSAALEEKLIRMESDFAQAKESQQVKAEVSARLSLLERIKKMTGGGKLMEWLAEEYIEDFTELASEKLSMLTNGEMELRYSKKGFTIVDNFNNRAERKVATVSGGETFLVSLSLAVAIAAKLEERAGARRIEFLFIDEGFGTLSADKIDLVMDALCSLGKQDFVVGFISHVQEMRTRIPHQLIVTREDSEEGSRVTML